MRRASVFLCVALAASCGGGGVAMDAGGDAGTDAGGAHGPRWPIVASGSTLGTTDVTPSPMCQALTRGTWLFDGTCGGQTCTLTGDAATPCMAYLSCGSDTWHVLTNGDVLGMAIDGGSCTGLVRPSILSGTCDVGGTTCMFDATFLHP